MLNVDTSCAMIVRKNGKTSLHTAGRYGLLRIVKALIENDVAIVGIKDKKGQTALHMAVKGQSLKVVEEILQANYSILNERDRKWNTALHVATRKTRPQDHCTMGWTFSHNTFMADIGSEVKREVSAGIATVSRMMERLEARENSRPSTASTSNDSEDHTLELNNEHNISEALDQHSVMKEMLKKHMGLLPTECRTGRMLS